MGYTFPSSPVKGEIYNEPRARQLTNFAGLQFERGITPTNIDGFVEFDDQVFIYIENKYADAQLPGGQRKALIRACDRLFDSGAHSLLIIARHYHPVDEMIDAAQCEVTEYRSGKKSRVPPRYITVREMIEAFKRFAAAPQAD